MIALEKLHGLEGSQVVLVGINLKDSPGFRALRAQLPHARVLDLTDGPSEPDFIVSPRNPAIALKLLLGLHPHAIVAVQDYQKLRVLALAVPTARHLVLRHGELEPIDLGQAARQELNRLWTKVRPPSSALRKEDLSPDFGRPLGPGNQYDTIAQAVTRLPSDWPRLFASVIVPVYNRRPILEKTLAALRRQTYPKDKFEVIVADDGSQDDPASLVASLANELNIRIVRQEDMGFRAAQVRNLAIREAKGQVIVCLDCDMLPPRRFLSAHLRWFHATTLPLVVLGVRRFVDTHDLSAEAIFEDPQLAEALPDVPGPDVAQHGGAPTLDWRIPRAFHTNMLKTSKAPFALMGAGNVSFTKALVDAVGGFDETFQRWGGEDVELGYRMWRRGAYFVMDPETTALHQDHPSPVNRPEDQAHTRKLLGSKVPHWRSWHDASTPIEAPKVSVYIPAYNAEAWIQRAVHSALAQTLTDLEVCICDDGSTDKTVQVLRTHYSDHPRVRWVTQRNAGISAASNRAVALCRGEYILQLDSDDELLPEAAEVLSQLLDADSGLSVAYGGFETVDPNQAIYQARVVLPVPYDALAHMHGNIICHPRMFRARDFYRTAGFDESLENAVDFDIYLRLAEVGRVKPVERVLYRYYIHGKNTSVARRDAQFKNHLRVIENALERRNLDWIIAQPDRKNARRVQFRHPETKARAWFKR